MRCARTWGNAGFAASTSATLSTAPGTARCGRWTWCSRRPRTPCSNPAATDIALHVLHAATHEHTGAGRAAVRTHCAVAKTGIRSELLVLHGTGAEPGIEVLGGPLRQRVADLRLRAENALLSLQLSGDGAYRSLGFGGPGLARIRSKSADVVHLHWIPELLGIPDLSAINRPVVWTFHDQWPICGAEHYTELARPRTGYEAGNR